MATYRSYIRTDFSTTPLVEYVSLDNVSNVTTQGSAITGFTLALSDQYQRWYGFFQPGSDGEYHGPIYGVASYGYNGAMQGSVTGMDITLAQYDALPDSASVMQFVLRGDDVLYGSSYGDLMMGYEGNDYILGGTDDYDYDDGGDILLGNGGNDTIIGLYGDDSMVGGSTLLDASDGADKMWGWYGNDHLYGSGGNDSLYGGAGNDLLVGVWGDDVIWGEEGNDILVFFGQCGYDTVLDFQQGDILSINRTASIQSFTDLASRMFSDANGTFIPLEAGSGITLAGVQASQLDAGDFYFWG